ncbi:four-helix bundle copper-binding protein [Glaciecola sp. 2405UD65-10]|jgi:Cys-rich four helix bundle protein (predicted Tat secretion target)|uniref:four-helix bundle copper-binding protein n=1 Tax=Glaciecola sp. 2405UD65-10 TaxID=3397244 RepID=UPI003B5C7A3C
MVNQQQRRKLISSLGLVTAAVATSPALAAIDGHGKHEAKMPGKAAHKYDALIEATQGCIASGNVCLDHCIALVADDDTSIADCLRTTRAMLPALEAMVSLASSSNANLPAMAKVCLALCEDCRVECEKHAHHHAQCKACMESCEICIEACKKIAA